MSNKHSATAGRDIHKRGMLVEIKHTYNNFENPEKASELRAKSFEAALKTLKRRMVQEGMIRDMRRKEYYESKGQIRRKKQKEGIRRTQKAAKEAEW
jgi:small subunit ribosomal protein S21